MIYAVNRSARQDEVITIMQVRELLAACLELDPSLLPENPTRENVEGWDSIIHLSLLGLLEDVSPGVLDEFPKVAEAQSIEEIHRMIGSR